MIGKAEVNLYFIFGLSPPPSEISTIISWYILFSPYFNKKNREKEKQRKRIKKSRLIIFVEHLL